VRKDINNIVALYRKSSKRAAKVVLARDSEMLKIGKVMFYFIVCVEFSSARSRDECFKMIKEW
jgi:hypothetical protein